MIEIDLRGLKKVINPSFYPLLSDTSDILVIRGGAGSGKCMKKGTEIIMYDGSLKKVEDIKVGDLLMGPDSKPRKVLSTTSGYGKLYKVKQNIANDYVVNDKHILSLKKATNAKSNGRYNSFDDVINIPVEEFIKQSKRFKRNFYGYKVKIDFEKKDVDIDPYYLGAWLGDGHSHKPSITSMDTEIIDYCIEYAEKLGLKITYKEKPTNKAVDINIVKNGTQNNKLTNKLRKYNLIKNKHIPLDFIANNEKTRLEVLAGLLDTDGYFHSNCYEITQKNERLARDIKYLVDTLGFKTSIKKVKKTCTNNGVEGIYFKVSIGGDVWRIPCKIERKKCKEENCSKNKDWLITGIEVEDFGYGEYYGFLLDGDSLFLLEDGTVTHNSFFIRQKLVARILNDLDENFTHRFICLRKTAPYARLTLFIPFLSLLKDWGFYYKTGDKRNLVDVNRTNMTITFPNGSEIRCMGLDDPEKIKSVEGVTSIWLEEATDFSIDDFRQCTIRMRGKTDTYKQLILSFNPISDLNWVYKEFYDESNPGKHEDVSLHFSTYKDNKWLDAKDKRKLEKYEEIDYNFYRVYTLGEWGSLTNIIFNHWKVVKNYPSDLKDIVCGLDFGYSHPLALMKVGIGDEGIYTSELIYGQKKQWDRVIRNMERIFAEDDDLSSSTPIYCDNSSPDKVDDLRRAGFNAIPVYKGNDKKVKQEGIDLLRRNKLYVLEDSINIQKELRTYKYKEDKDGNVSEDPVKINDDCIDALRYAVFMKLRKNTKLEMLFVNL